MNKYNEVTKYFMKQLKTHIHQKKTSKRLKKYYVERKTDGRSSFGKVLDYIGSRIIVFFASLLLLLIIIKHLLTASLLSILLTSLFHTIDIQVRNKKTEKIINQKRKYLASQRVYREIMGKSMEEIYTYLEQVFEDIGFRKTEKGCIDDKEIYFLYQYGDIHLPVFFKMNPYDENTQLKEIENYSEKLKKMDFIKGMIIATTDFTKECYDFAERNNHPKLILVEKEKLLKMIDKAGLFPTDKEMDEYVVDRIEKRERKIAVYRETLLSKSKTRRYAILGLFLLFWAQFTPYSGYYNFMAMLLFSLAILTFYCNIKGKVDSEKEFNLEQFIEG
ncbi:Restriction endonuclease [Geosporobacter subterraneus DSM 17957]|uniref:Restriction endonuclease n=1 Tax=Geosporobacter subterraneus DSM 17957 TaxID=1121919 RepID=A0A1M6GXT3_9FIRM|nr:restriction endonuclease [Geosporobacter subterraneus]SHJ14763.1 Restriction endonuclease [Geosporobacter subterraneus DSM 17957]